MVVADDKTIEKKDKTADEPVQFYIHGVPRPYEIVVFDVTKDKVNGYLSTPKDAGTAAGCNSRTSATSPDFLSCVFPTGHVCDRARWEARSRPKQKRDVLLEGFECGGHFMEAAVHAANTLSDS